MFRVILCIAALTAMTILLAHHHSADVVPADLVFADTGQVNTLDPQRVSSSADIRLCINLWEGLTGFDPADLRPIAAAAQLPATVSTDRLTWTFTLRADGRWSNGDAVTAHDFVRGWRRAIEPGTAGNYAALVTEHIDGAADYAEWRYEAAGRLTRLWRLARGAVPTVADLDATGPFPEGAVPLDWAAADWARHHAEALARHRAERSHRWDTVGVTALDAHTLRVRLVRPTPYFLDLTALPVFMPIHRSIDAAASDPDGLSETGLIAVDTEWTKPESSIAGYPGVITNGPYRLERWRFRRDLRLVPNAHHRAATALRCRVIERHMYEDVNAAFWAYETGAVDWLVVLSIDAVTPLLELSRRGERPDIRTAPAFGTFFYNLNCQDAVLPDGRPNPFVDVRVRRAFSLAVDRAALCDRVVTKQNPPCRTLVPPGSIRDYPLVPTPPDDGAAARQLLDAAGYTDRTTFPPVSILYSAGLEHQRLAEALAHMWKDVLGVSVTLDGKEGKAFWHDKEQHNFHIARGGWYGDYADPTTFLDICATGNGNNDSGFADPHYMTLLEQARSSPNAMDRLERLAEAERYLVNDAFPIIPLFQYTNPQAVAAQVSGVHPNGREIYPFAAIAVTR